MWGALVTVTTLALRQAGAKRQTETSVSHIGGFPVLAPGEPVPTCGQCDAVMSFLIQVTPGNDHLWAGRTLALFECTACPDDTPNRFLAPGSSDRSWADAKSQGIQVTEEFLAGNRLHHRLIVSDLAAVVMRQDIPERVAYRRLEPREVAEPYLGLKVGGVPSWHDINVIYEEARFGQAGVVFLFQIPTRRGFRRLPSAPRQQYFPDVWDDDYFLFNGAPAFCFGTIDREEPAAFLIPAAEMAANVKPTPCETLASGHHSGGMLESATDSAVYQPPW